MPPFCLIAKLVNILLSDYIILYIPEEINSTFGVINPNIFFKWIVYFIIGIAIAKTA